MAEPISTAVALTASLAGAKKIAEASVGYLQGLAIDKYQIKKSEKILRNITDRIIEVRKVKTILDLEKEVDIGDFYTPQHVRVGEKRVLVSCVSALPYDGNTVFTGVAGQGKSVFFRYLAARVPEDGVTLPLFIELRRLAHQSSIKELILKELGVLGFPAQERVFDWFAENGRIVLFLDAYDEVPVDKQSRFVADIEDVCRMFPSLKVLITSRPNNGIESSPQFRVVALDNLRNDEYKQIVRKITGGTEISGKIIAGVENESCRIKHLLSTPLMVTLLVLRYKIDASIPDNEEAFYGDLFDLLARRHDKTKSGFARGRRTDATETKLERLFGGVCFLSRLSEDVEISRSELAGYAEKSNVTQALGVEAENAIYDVADITCLLLEESGVYQFPHRTIQEFFAARYLKDRPDEVKRRFYRKIFDSWGSWEQMLRFLEILDVYQFRKQFLLPNARQWLAGSVDSDPKKLSVSKKTKARERIFGSDSAIAFRIQRENGEEVTKSVFFAFADLNEKFYLLRRSDVYRKVSEYLSSIIGNAIPLEALDSIAEKIERDPRAEVMHLSLANLWRDPRFSELSRILDQATDELVVLYAKYQDEVAGVESLSDLIDY